MFARFPEVEDPGEGLGSYFLTKAPHVLSLCLAKGISKLPGRLSREVGPAML